MSAAEAPDEVPEQARPAAETRQGIRLAGLARNRWALLAAAGILAAATVAISVAAFSRSRTDIDSVVAGLTERLQQQNVSQDAIRQSVAAAQALGASGRAEERSAFAALAAGDSLQAVAVLGDLAGRLEARGETAAAAEVYTRIGAIALVVDQGRGLHARQRAFELDPASLAAFQGLFFDTAVLKGAPEAATMADELLATASLTPRMRGWVLAHKAIMYIDSVNAVQDMENGEMILREIRELRDRTGDAVLDAASYWTGGLYAFSRDDLRAARGLAERTFELWPELPERLSNAGEVMLIRVLYAQGERERAFVMAADSLDRRSRTGDFLPIPIIVVACEAGVFTGSVQRATPFCESMASRFDASHGAEAKAFAGLAAAANGDLDLAGREFDAGNAVAPPGSALLVRLMFFEAWAAMKARKMDEAEQLIREVDDRAAKLEYAEGYRSFRAHAWWLLGEGFIAADQKSRACAPLAESARLYAEVGGDAGRAAVDALKVAAGCRPT